MIDFTKESDIHDIYINLHRPYVLKYSEDENREWENHKNWYNFMIHSDSYMLFTIRDKNEFCGYINIELDDEIAILNIFIVKDKRNCGLATSSIFLIEKKIKEKYSNISIVLAYILEENSVSMNLFEKLGYTYDGLENYKGIEHKLFIKFI